MKVFEWIWKGFVFMFPFFKELLFGDPDASQDAYHRNKMVVFLIGCLVVLFIFYYYNTYKFDMVIAANSDLSEKKAVLQIAYTDIKNDDDQKTAELVEARMDAVCPPPATAAALNKRIAQLRIESEQLTTQNQQLQQQVDDKPILVCPPVPKAKAKHR